MQTWKEFAHSKVQELYVKLDKPYLSRRELARMLAANEASLARWIDNGIAPSQMALLSLSAAFQRLGVSGSDFDWLEAAGYPASHSDVYQATKELLDAVNAPWNLEEADQKHFSPALTLLLEPNWRRKHPITVSLINSIIMRSPFVWTAKIDYIYNLVELAELYER